tara:strand:+ start:259 stop:1302 length:1044 start_codon:yes stop_codon:yes gene_type:complete
MSTYTVSGITYDTATGRPINRDGGLLLDSEIKASSISTNTTTTGKTRDRKFKSLRYPVARLESDSDYLEIKVLEYQAPGFETSGTGQSLRLQTSSESLKNNEIILGHIFLPIPEAITDSNGVTWGEDSLNGLAATGVGVAQDVISSNNLQEVGQAGGRAGQSLQQLLGDDATTSAINATFASMAVNALGGQTSAGGVLARQTGSILNPNMELLFGGVQLRQFSFSFDFAPRDENESIVIKKIIRAFKKSLNAKNSSTGENKGTGLFIKSPDVFQLTYKTGASNHQFLHKFKPMALLNIGVNYTGAGTYATYDNTAPVHTKIDLTFQELNPIYSEDYDTEEGLEGTGF